MRRLIQPGGLTKLILVLLFCAAPVFASAGTDDGSQPSPSIGLMWNRTGLPAVFPLQVKSPAGQNYFLTLVDDKTGKDALAAYIKGGIFFKVLVPPGVFRLKFAAGNVWQGEEKLFGEGTNTQAFELEKPLTFKIRGLGVKSGHLVNILDIERGQIVEARVKDQNICQSLMEVLPSPVYPSWDDDLTRDIERGRWVRTENGRLKYLDDSLFGQILILEQPEDFFPGPRYEVRAQYCG
ncbi:MAG: hypothetical protein WBB25_04885 [Sulfitobacter sp.]